MSFLTLAVMTLAVAPLHYTGSTRASVSSSVAPVTSLEYQTSRWQQIEKKRSLDIILVFSPHMLSLTNNVEMLYCHRSYYTCRWVRWGGGYLCKCFADLAFVSSTVGETDDITINWMGVGGNYYSVY